jgi:hypothetical protein
VAVRVIADGTELHAIPWCGFNIYENRRDAQQPIVTIEIPHARLTVTDEADVQIYRDQLALLRHAAGDGRDAVEIIQTAASRLA